MAVFALQKPITTTVPTIAVDNQLAAGTHVFQLVVVNDSGVQSDPVRVNVIVSNVVPQNFPEPAAASGDMQPPRPAPAAPAAGKTIRKRARGKVQPAPEAAPQSGAAPKQEGVVKSKSSKRAPRKGKEPS